MGETLGVSRPIFVIGSIFLFCYQEAVLLLALLHEEVLAVEQVGCGEQLIWSGGLVFVDAYTAALDEGLHFALAGEYLSVVNSQVGKFHKTSSRVCSSSLRRLSLVDLPKRMLEASTAIS